MYNRAEMSPDPGCNRHVTGVERARNEPGAIAICRTALEQAGPVPRKEKEKETVTSADATVDEESVPSAGHTMVGEEGAGVTTTSDAASSWAEESRAEESEFWAEGLVTCIANLACVLFRAGHPQGSLERLRECVEVSGERGDVASQVRDKEPYSTYKRAYMHPERDLPYSFCALRRAPWPRAL